MASVVKCWCRMALKSRDHIGRFQIPHNICGDPGRARTCNLRSRIPTLYPLSHGTVTSRLAARNADTGGGEQSRFDRSAVLTTQCEGRASPANDRTIQTAIKCKLNWNQIRPTAVSD